MSGDSEDAEMAPEKTYGGCEGKDSEYVKLVSSDGHEFIVKREFALASGTIKAMLSGPGNYVENETNQVVFREIPSHVLQKVCEYFSFHAKYSPNPVKIPAFPIPLRMGPEMLLASAFLDL